MMRMLVSLRALVVAIGCILGVAQPTLAAATVLSDVANSMQPGTFAAVSGMNGWNNGGILSPTNVSGCTSDDYITEYADKAAWDPVGLRLDFVGQVHGNCYAGRFVIYTDSSSTWSQGPWPSGICQSGTASSPCFSHAYGHNTVDPTTGDFYFRQAYTMQFFRYRSGAWSSIPAPATQSSQCCGALEYFKDMGRLIFLDGDWGLWAFNPANNSWTQLANTHVANGTPGLPNLDMPSTIVFAVYDPVQKIVLFGGGSNLYELTSTGSIKTMRAPPVSLGVTNAVTSVDPVGGKYIVLSGRSMYQYDPVADSWSQLAIPVPSVMSAMLGVGDGLVAADVTTYGVIMYVKFDGASSQVYLYKHSASAPVQPPPAAPPKPDPPSDVTVH